MGESYWELLYRQFQKRFPNVVRHMFCVVTVFIPVKIIMSLEGHEVTDTVPDAVWVWLRKHLCKRKFAKTPTYVELLQIEIVDTAIDFHAILPALDAYKFNKLPASLNDTDVILHSCLHKNKVSWRTVMFLFILVRRFANNGAWLMAILQFLSLDADTQSLHGRSPTKFLEIDLADDYTKVVENLLYYFDAAAFQAAQEFSTKLFGSEATFGYMLPAWNVQNPVAGRKRLSTFTDGVQAAGKFCTTVESFIEAKSRLHEVVTSGAGFIIYQIDMLIDNFATQSGVRGVFSRERHAGPGMVPFALEMAFGLDIGPADESVIAPSRDDVGSAGGDASKISTDPDKATKKRKKTMFRCTDGHRRQSVAACNYLSELMFATQLWSDLCMHYNLTSMLPQTNNSQEKTEIPFDERYRVHTAAILNMYDLLEYALCELRRLLFCPKPRQPQSKASGSQKKSSGNGFLDEWMAIVKPKVAQWRSQMKFRGLV